MEKFYWPRILGSEEKFPFFSCWQVACLLISFLRDVRYRRVPPATLSCLPIRHPLSRTANRCKKSATREMEIVTREMQTGTSWTYTLSMANRSVKKEESNRWFQHLPPVTFLCSNRPYENTIFFSSVGYLCYAKCCFNNLDKTNKFCFPRN